jgi:hypothetical protein
MILPRIIELKSKNRQELKEGKVTVRAIVNTAGNRPDPFLGVSNGAVTPLPDDLRLRFLRPESL